MQKIFLINLFVILGLSFTQGMDETEKDKTSVTPTSVTTRSKFFKTHLDDDQAIFKEMSKWHEEDYAALARTVKVVANQENLGLIHDTLNKVFDNGTVTHGKIAAAYKAYSAVISSKSEMGHAQDTEGAYDDEIIQEVIEYCIDGKIREQTQHCISHIDQITLAEKNNLRWLPYVSRKGLSTFRILNSQFGMKAPLIGLPLERSSYDGNLDETPFSFFRHDANHGRFSDANNNSPEVIDFIYNCYHEADAIVSPLTDTKIQALCDFFLFEVGHESFFDIKTIWSEIEMDSEGQLKRTFTLQHPKDLNEVCDNILKRLEEEIHQFYQPSPLYTQIEIMFMKLIEERKDREELKDNVEFMRKSIRDRESILAPFIDSNREGQHLFTLIDLINKSKLSKEKPVSKKEIADSIQPGFLNTLPPHPFNAFENWCALELRLNFYNQLFGYQYFFNKNGISFDLWKDDVFQADAIMAVFKEACDTFKREVGTRFKGYETYLAKLDKIKDENSLKVQHYPTL